MLVGLPTKAGGLPEVEAQLTAGNIAQWVSVLSKTAVKVYLPKFAISSRYDLKDLLTQMGMAAPFQPGTADFSGISDSGGLYIDAAIHQSVISVVEKHTEAASSTFEGMAPGGLVEFRANHPFLFLIRHNTTNTILFIGRVINPSS